jgi:transcriptional regulator with XRE-family HTH domain
MEPSRHVAIDGRALRAARRHAGLSQARLAELLAVRTGRSVWAWQTSLSSLERDERRATRAANARALVDVLGPSILASSAGAAAA